MIYVMGVRSDGVVKIGIANDPVNRLKQIQAGHPEPLEVLLALPGDRRTEAYLHERFADRRVSAREWFDFTDDDAVTSVVAALAGEVPDEVEELQPVKVDIAEPRLRITLIGVKGGVATTTTAMMLGFTYAARAQRVAVVDNAQKSATTWCRLANDNNQMWPENLSVIPDWARGQIEVDVEIRDLGRACDIDYDVVDQADVIVLVTTPGSMEQHALDVSADFLRVVEPDRIGVLIAKVDERDCDGIPVHDEHEMRTHLDERHPQLAVFRNAIPHRVSSMRAFGQVPAWLGVHHEIADDIARAARINAGLVV